MEIRKLSLEGTFEIRSKKIGDSRGYFAETYRSKLFEEAGMQIDWAQENQSLTSKANTIRGLHFQAPPFAQAKLIRTPVGKVLDVFVDVRKGSPTYGKWDSVIVSEELCNAVYIPRGFAHGFCTLVDNVIVQYKVDSVYNGDSEGGIRWNDPDLGIEWGVDNPRLSERDMSMPLFAAFESPFKYLDK